LNLAGAKQVSPRCHRCSGIARFAVDIHHALRGLSGNEIDSGRELRGAHSREVEHGDIEVIGFEEFADLGKFGGEVENRGYSLTFGVGRLARINK